MMPNLPAGHKMHESEEFDPRSGRYAPARQSVHLGAPGAAEYFPAGQGEQTRLDKAPPTCPNVPAGHCVHTAAAVAPRLVPNVPAGQGSQVELLVALIALL